MKLEISIQDYKKMRDVLMALPASDVYDLLIKLDSQAALQLDSLGRAVHTPPIAKAKGA